MTILRGHAVRDPLDRRGQGGDPVIQRGAVLVGLQEDRLERVHLRRHLVKDCRDRARIARAFAIASGDPELGDRGQPFLEFAVETVLAVAGEEFQKTHDQRPGQTQKRGRERGAHAAELPLEPGQQAAEHVKRAFPGACVQRPDGLDHRGHGRGKTEERAQKTKEDQQVGQIARDVPRLVDPGGDGIEDRAGGRRADLGAHPALPQKCRERDQEPRRTRGFVTGILRGEPFDPADRPGQLDHLPEGRRHADQEHQGDEAVQKRIGQKDRSHPGRGDPAARRRQDRDKQHGQDLADRLGEARRRRRAGGARRTCAG